MEGTTWHKGSLGDEDDARTSDMCIACACTEKVHDTILDDEKYDVHYRAHPIGHITCMNVVHTSDSCLMLDYVHVINFRIVIIIIVL